MFRSSRRSNIPMAYATPVPVDNNDPNAPKKYVKKNGVMKLNPQYKRWKEAQTRAPATTVARPDVALAVVSSIDDHDKLNKDLGQDIPLAESTNATIEMMQEPEISLAAGLEPDEMVDQLGEVLEKYEVPIGLMNKLMMLSEYDSLEFIIDDSGSMRNRSDTMHPSTRKPNRRWDEAQQRLKEMIEILAYIPIQQVGIEFLNRTARIALERNGRNPQAFIQDAYAKIDEAFDREPRGSTPALEKLGDSLAQRQNQSTAWYFFGDGLPNGGRTSQKQIVELLMRRQDPARNPVTFVSCTNEDSQVEWMKDAEEVVPYCSESDDFGDEANEVLRDQGEAFPYTRGFYLICQLVAAMNPDDLDAMDESVPFTKTTLDNLLGITTNEESYKHYFTSFQKAQRKRIVEGPSDRLKKTTQWNYEQFLEAALARNIPQVQEFQRKMTSMILRQ